MMNPNTYQLPLLWTSKTWTLALKSETRNAKGEMNPCQSPFQKPATSPSSS